MITIDATKMIAALVVFLLYTLLVVFVTYKAVSPNLLDLGSDSQLADELAVIHEDEIERIQALHDKELAERDRILDEYQREVETARNDYWATISQIETQIRAQRTDIVRRIYEDPDAAAKILEDRYGLIYVP